MADASGLVLYSYWRSSASYRVRLALALKRLDYELRPIHLIHNGGEQHETGYRSINPQGLVPTLLHGAFSLTQSLAIIEYLDETFPQYPLLPKEAQMRARVRAMSQAIASDIAPIANLRVLQALEAQWDADEAQRVAWARHWIQEGLASVESLLSQTPARDAKTPYCFGSEPSMADCCLLPQVYNAERFGCDLTEMPTIGAICANLLHNGVIESAKPDNQPDATQ